ncbi:MAG: J domain-containing protein [Alphaproteobacteria bacterium]|nr:J domain-containing protein [Alphaproteobacteria bacterium]
MLDQKAAKAKSRARALHPAETRGGARACGWPGCAGEGAYRAPKSRRNLNAFHWFCLDHIRAYNNSWNYYSGMTEAEVEADLRHDTVWQRPSWRWGTQPGANETELKAALFGHPFGPDEAEDNPAPPFRRRTGAETEQEKAMAILGLKPPLSRGQIKTRYKELAKLHHPDVANGNKESADKFRDINHAYKILMDDLAR